MIKYDPSLPFLDYFGMYQIPSTLQECVDQYRIDRITEVMNRHAVGEDVYEVLSTGPESRANNFGEFCCPTIYFDDKSLNARKPGTRVSLPPVPTDLAAKGVLGADLWLQSEAPYKLYQASDETVLLIAELIAAAFLDDNYRPTDRNGALRYIAINNLDHPASRILQKNRVWEQHRRILQIPDMIETRKQDFRKLFEQAGQPLDPHELECLSDQELLSCATDIRSYILARNRHVVFCKHCNNAMLHMNIQTMAPVPLQVC